MAKVVDGVNRELGLAKITPTRFPWPGFIGVLIFQDTTVATFRVTNKSVYNS